MKKKIITSLIMGSVGFILSFLLSIQVNGLMTSALRGTLSFLFVGILSSLCIYAYEFVVGPKVVNESSLNSVNLAHDTDMEKDSKLKQEPNAVEQGSFEAINFTADNEIKIEDVVSFVKSDLNT